MARLNLLMHEMRALMEVVRINLTEALDRPSAIEWKKDELGWRGDFQTPSGRWFTILISRLKDEGSWAFEFSETPHHVLWLSGRAEKPEPTLSPNPVGTRRPTGRGEQFSVYSTVLDAMRQFLTTERPRSVRFKGAVGKQTTLYQAMMSRHADEIRNMGYRRKGAALVAIQERPITEAVVEQVGNPPYPVLTNPSSNSLSRFISNTSHKLAKGLFDPTSNTAFFWDAYKATHAMAETDLGLDDPVAIIVGFNDDGKIALDVMAHDERPKALNHPALKGINNDPDDSFMRRWQ